MQNYKNLLRKEKELLGKFFESNEKITKVYYNEDLVIIQFSSDYSLTSQYLESLKDLIDYKEYVVKVVTITNEIFKLKYDEQILQLNIIL